MEIRIIFERVDPPAGHLGAIPHAGGDDVTIRFTGWLGLLRALYEATGAPGDGPLPG